jgi:hypothetical protein
MRIDEIVDTEFKDVERKTPYNTAILQKQERRTARRGSASAPSGWYSGGYQNPRDPHEYVKTTHKPSYLHDDAYYLYVSAIAHLQKKNYRNPYFPVVYQVKVTSDPRGMDRPRYRIETLQSFENYPVESIMGMIDRMFINPEYVISRKVEYTNEKNKGVLWRDMADYLDKIVMGAHDAEMLSNVKDPLLKQALSVINKILLKRESFEPDIHHNNIMIRGTPVGPQLVLMDPISDGGASIVPDDDIDDHYEYDDHQYDDDEDDQY